MKRCLLLLTIIVIALRSQAQVPPAHSWQNLVLENETDCTVYYNMVARCKPNCNPLYSNGTMTLLPNTNSPNSPITNPLNAFQFLDPSGGYYSPECEDWEWVGADVDIVCADSTYHFHVSQYGVGNPLACSPYYSFGAGTVTIPCCNNGDPIHILMNVGAGATGLHIY